MAVHVKPGYVGEKPLTWKGGPGYKPIIILIVGSLFTLFAILPPPQGLVDLVKKEGPPGYELAKGCNSITETVNKKLRPEAFQAYQDEKQGIVHEAATKSHHGHEPEPLLTSEEVARLAMIMVLILFTAASLWGLEALPLGGHRLVGRGFNVSVHDTAHQ